MGGSKDQGAAGFPLAFTRCGRAQSACRLCPLYTGPGLLEGSSSTRLDGRQRWLPKTPLQRNAAQGSGDLLSPAPGHESRVLEMLSHALPQLPVSPHRRQQPRKTQPGLHAHLASEVVEAT